MAQPPKVPPLRIVREGEIRMCRDCGSGCSAHRRGSDRVDHKFNPTPSWWRRLFGGR